MPLLAYHANGILEFRAQSGVAIHKCRLHTSKFNPATGVYDPVDATAAGKLNFAGDNDIYATATAWLAVMRTFYSSAWQLSFSNALSYVSPGVYAWAGPGSVASVLGSDPNASPDDVSYANQLSVNLRDYDGNRAKVTLLGVTAWNTSAQVMAAGSDGAWNGVVSFLTGANHPIVSRHNRGLVGPGRLTFTLNRRLRRKYGMA